MIWGVRQLVIGPAQLRHVGPPAPRACTALLVNLQHQPTIAKRYQGTGLGLALTKQLVQLYGGQSWADFKAEGLGKSFTVRLPWAPSG